MLRAFIYSSHQLFTILPSDYYYAIMSTAFVAHLVLHPKMSQTLKVLATTVGRDKVRPSSFLPFFFFAADLIACLNNDRSTGSSSISRD
jgi:hypothetical protein